MVLEIKTHEAIKCILTTRTGLPDLKERLKREFPQPGGVYVLFRNGRGRQFPRIYIGAAGLGKIADLTDRLSFQDNPNNQPLSWTHCYVFIGRNRNLTPSRIGYIEARLIRLAEETKRSNLVNIQSPKIRRRSGANDQFVNDILQCLEKFDVDWFSSPAARKVNTKGNRNYHLQGRIILYLEGKGVKAQGYTSGDKFVVMARSEAVKQETKALRENNPTVCELRRELARTKVISSTGKIYRFARDVQFNSSSQAATFILGNPFAGPRVWKDSTGQLLRDIE